MTQFMEWSHVDKSEWGDGPWQNEPDKRQWTDATTGLPCLIVRGPSGALCGYVGVSRAHPLHSKGYSESRVFRCTDSCGDEWHYGCSPEALVAVHGGLTFSGGCRHGDDPSKGICHIPSPGQPDDVWWFGFDCAHAGDLCPERHYRFDPADVYRDAAYVTEQVTQLASQLAVLRP